VRCEPPGCISGCQSARLPHVRTVTKD
jgi:hypothetical protein